MSDALSDIITNIQSSSIIQNNQELHDNLEKINVFKGSIFEKAFLLGLFFKYKSDSDYLPPELKASLIYTIKKNHLEQYYYLKTKPRPGLEITFAITFVMIGLVALLCGLTWAINNIFSVGIGMKYLDFRVRDGWTYILFGLACLIGGIIYLKNEIRKRRFIRSCLEQYGYKF